MRFHRGISTRSRLLWLARHSAVLLLCACSSNGESQQGAGANHVGTQAESTLLWPETPLPRAELLSWYNLRNETVMAVSASKSSAFVAVAARTETSPQRMRIDFWPTGFSEAAVPAASTREEVGSVELRSVYAGAMRGVTGDVLLTVASGESDIREVLLFTLEADGRSVVLSSTDNSAPPLVLAADERILLCIDSAGLVAFSASGTSVSSWWYASNGKLIFGERPRDCRLA